MEKSLLTKYHSCNLFYLAVILLSFSIPESSIAQKAVQEPFYIYGEYVQRICDYHKQFPHVEFVYGNPNLETDGFLVVVEPYPERAWATTYLTKVPSNNFRVWIEAGQQTSSGWNTFGLFSKNNKTVQYLDIPRKNKSAFALYISHDELIERIPHGDLHNITPVFNFNLRFKFAKSNTAKWPSEWAAPIAHPGRVNQWYFHFYPGEFFLSNKVEWTDEADIYMDKNPKKSYFFDRELVWQNAGWYFNLSYRQKNYIKEKVNNNHYVIVSFWKDEKHTQPIPIHYLKKYMLIGGFSDNPEEEENRYNYVAYPHKGFEDWSLFIPWTAINYWWRDGIKATKDNHICYGYYTLTLSNDGKTPATNHDFDYSGWLSLDLEYKEPTPEEIKRDSCKHLHRKQQRDKRSPISVPIGGGCTREFDVYWNWEECIDCGWSNDHTEIWEPISDRCEQHNLKEVSRSVKDKFRKIDGVDDNIIIETTVYEVKYECQNYCCNYKESKDEYGENKTIIERPHEPEFKSVPEPKCPPHSWIYASALKWGNKTITKEKATLPPYDEPTLKIDIDSTSFNMIKIDPYTYISEMPVRGLQWIGLNHKNNYLGITKENEGLLTSITYQEVFDFISQLNKRLLGSDNSEIKATFSLPTVDEMRQFLAKEPLKLEKYEARQITSFYVDTIEVYDGKDRLIPEDKLATAPEGAKVRVMVGCMDKNGQVKMVDIATCNNETAFFVKAVTSETEAFRTLVRPGRLYRIYTRKCQWCGVVEPVSENIFYNMRYHRPLINN